MEVRRGVRVTTFHSPPSAKRPPALFHSPRGHPACPPPATYHICNITYHICNITYHICHIIYAIVIQVYITSVSHLYHICIIFVSHLYHICITSVSHLYHICITSVSHLYHICDIAIRQPSGITSDYSMPVPLHPATESLHDS